MSTHPIGWQINRLDDVTASPWRNGGGLTRELLAWPRADEWTLRLSVAEITQDGPFSSFPSIERWFAVLHGAGVRLRIGEHVHELTPESPPLQFAGRDRTVCDLIDGPTRDFNLMLRGKAASMERVRGAVSKSCLAGSLVAVYANRSAVQLRSTEGQLELPPDTLAWRILEADLCVELIGGDALWMEMVR